MQSQIPANRVNDQKEHHSIAIYEIIHPDDREYLSLIHISVLMNSQMRLK